MQLGKSLSNEFLQLWIALEITAKLNAKLKKGLELFWPSANISLQIIHLGCVKWCDSLPTLALQISIVFFSSFVSCITFTPPSTRCDILFSSLAQCARIFSPEAPPIHAESQIWELFHCERTRSHSRVRLYLCVYTMLCYVFILWKPWCSGLIKIM